MKPVQFQVLHILAALGAGGMTASFFFVVNFMTEHPHPFIDFDSLMANYIGQTDLLSLIVQLYIVGTVISATIHFWLLSRWFKGFNQFRKTQAFNDLMNSNKEVQLMAIPLTLTMSMNVFFMLGAIFIPGLFSEITLFGMTAQLFDFMLVFAGIYFTGMLYLALRIFAIYWSRLTDGHFDFIENANLAQMLAIFAFGMIAVSISALSISKVEGIAVYGMSMGYIVLSLALILGAIKLLLGFKSIFEHGMAAPATVTLLLPVAIIGMITVALFRNDIGVMHTLHTERDTGYHLLIFTIGIGVSFFIGLFALSVMKKKEYFKKLKSNELDASAFALICPGFAFEVQLVLWLNVGLVFTGIVSYGSWAFFSLWAPMIVLQAVTIYFMFILLKHNRFLNFQTVANN